MAGLAGILVPNAVELFGHVFAPGLPLAQFFFHRAFDLHPVVGVLGIDQQNCQTRILRIHSHFGRCDAVFTNTFSPS